MSPKGLSTIREKEYLEWADEVKHIFLVGDLAKPVSHPFIRRRDVELILCFYQPGDNGCPHWHPEVTEIEIVTKGKIGYLEIESGTEFWFTPGDLIYIPPMCCVQRLVPEPSKIYTVKLPSISKKVQCRTCPRYCRYRIKEEAEQK